MELTAVLTPAEAGGYIALNPGTGTTTEKIGTLAGILRQAEVS